MKKYYIVILLTILTALMTQLVYPKEQDIEPEWIESCYGIECLTRAEPTPPNHDWGYSATYCMKQYHVEIKNNNNETIKEFEYLTGICKL